MHGSLHVSGSVGSVHGGGGGGGHDGSVDAHVGGGHAPDASHMQYGSLGSAHGGGGGKQFGSVGSVHVVPHDGSPGMHDGGGMQLGSIGSVHFGGPQLGSVGSVHGEHAGSPGMHGVGAQSGSGCPVVGSMQPVPGSMPLPTVPTSHGSPGSHTVKLSAVSPRVPSAST